MNVGDLMTTEVSTCNSESDLESIARLMWDKDCGSVPVLSNSGTPIGIVTDRDIAMGCALNHKALWEMRAEEILNNRELYTCRPEDDIRTALRLMSEHHIHRLPVVDHSGSLQGILSIDDVIARAKSGVGKKVPEPNYDDTMQTLKSICTHH
jgi:CBS domain-containing protein